MTKTSRIKMKSEFLIRVINLFGLNDTQIVHFYFVSSEFFIFMVIKKKIGI
jgi:hypothetical protein